MSYQTYSTKYREHILSEFFRLGSKLYPFCSEKKLNPRTFYRWLERDERSKVKTRLRAFTSTLHMNRS